MTRVRHMHVVAQRVGARLGHRLPVLAAQLEQCVWTDGAVEVTMELRLGKPPKQLPTDRKLGHVGSPV